MSREVRHRALGYWMGQDLLQNINRGLRIGGWSIPDGWALRIVSRPSGPFRATGWWQCVDLGVCEAVAQWSANQAHPLHFRGCGCTDPCQRLLCHRASCHFHLFPSPLTTRYSVHLPSLPRLKGGSRRREMRGLEIPTNGFTPHSWARVVPFGRRPRAPQVRNGNRDEEADFHLSSTTNPRPFFVVSTSHGHVSVLLLKS